MTLTNEDLLTQETRQAVLTRATARDPRENPWGYFGEDDSLVASAGTFAWFPTREELLEALVEAEPAVYVAPGDPAFEAMRGGLARVREKALGRKGLSASLRDEANEVLRGEVQIGWWGTWEELVSGGSEFEKELRTWFRELVEDEDEDEEGRDLAAPITAEELQVFVEFIAEYGD
jgi:hypothetical protein